jgi:hypothetical protein
MDGNRTLRANTPMLIGLGVFTPFFSTYGLHPSIIPPSLPPVRGLRILNFYWSPEIL